jgi:hypothetical protein
VDGWEYRAGVQEDVRMTLPAEYGTWRRQVWGLNGCSVDQIATAPPLHWLECARGPLARLLDCAAEEGRSSPRLALSLSH